MLFGLTLSPVFLFTVANTSIRIREELYKFQEGSGRGGLSSAAERMDSKEEAEGELTSLEMPLPLGRGVAGRASPTEVMRLDQSGLAFPPKKGGQSCRRNGTSQAVSGS